MKSALFTLKGIPQPGTVHLYKVGQVKLCEASDEVLLNAYQQGCPFLEPTEDGKRRLQVVDKKPEVTPITITKKTASTIKTKKK